MAVFLLMAVLLVQMSDNTMQLTNHSQRRIGADGNALLAMDRISDDLATAVVRSDLRWRVQKQNGNDRFAFFASARAYTPGRKVSKVGYEIADSMLKRGIEAVSWENAGPNSLTFIPADSAGSSDYLEIDESNFELLDPNIFRLEISFLNAGGEFVSDPTPPGTTLVDFSASQEIEPQDRIVAAVVTVASITEHARALMPEGELNALTGKLLDATDGRNPLESWQAYLESSDPSLSQPAREAIRFRQRFIPIGQ